MLTSQLAKLAWERHIKEYTVQSRTTRDNTSHVQNNDEHERLTLGDLNTISRGFASWGCLLYTSPSPRD